MRQVFTNMSFARFHLFRCHEIDYSVRFDVAGMNRQEVLKKVEIYMKWNYPGLEYRITKPFNRPGYCDVRFSKRIA